MVTAVRVDARGRVVLPRSVRRELGIEPGDVFFVRQEGGVLQLARAENPFDVLAAQALREDDAGETVGVEQVAHAWGVGLDQLRAEARAERQATTE